MSPPWVAPRTEFTCKESFQLSWLLLCAPSNAPQPTPGVIPRIPGNLWQFQCRNSHSSHSHVPAAWTWGVATPPLGRSLCRPGKAQGKGNHVESRTQEQHQAPPPSSRQDLEAGKRRMFQHKMVLVRKCHSLGQSLVAFPPPLIPSIPPKGAAPTSVLPAGEGAKVAPESRW